jgi:tetratricopeptide (TPR) repeat protein
MNYIRRRSALFGATRQCSSGHDTVSPYMPIASALDWVSPFTRHPVVILTILIFAFLVVKLVRDAAPFWAAYPALKRGEYDLGLRRLAGIAWFSKSAPVLFLKGTVLMFAGRSAEAEAALRQSLVRETSPVHKSLVLVNIGYTLLAEGRYNEAKQALEEAIALRPDGAVAYSTLAEVYLRQGIEPQKALELLDRGIERKRASDRQMTVDLHIFGYLYANRAWALWLLGHPVEADEALDEARRYSAVDIKPGAAGVRYRIGRVLLAEKRNTEAAKEFRQARQIDPKGIYASLSEAALRDCG